jgi:hypothetical protein
MTPNLLKSIGKHALPWRVRKFALAFVLPGLLAAAILPDSVGAYKKTATAPVALDHQAVWNEYGLQASEQSTFELAGKQLHVEAYRLQDSTGALAAWQWKRPAGTHAADAKHQELSKLTAQSENGLTIALGNHLLLFQGYIPTADELANVFRSLPRQQSGPLPTLPTYLPAEGLIPNSERYVIGPASLALFSPEVNAATVAFHLGTEGQVAAYRSKRGQPLKLEIFSFPTLDSARDRATVLQTTPKAIVKRAGPLVAVVFSPKDINAAESLLSFIRFQAVVTGQDRSDHPLTKRDNWGHFMVNLFILIGVLLAFCLVSGVVFGGLRAILSRGGASGEGDAIITLHLDNR